MMRAGGYFDNRLRIISRFTWRDQSVQSFQYILVARPWGGGSSTYCQHTQSPGGVPVHRIVGQQCRAPPFSLWGCNITVQSPHHTQGRGGCVIYIQCNSEMYNKISKE